MVPLRERTRAPSPYFARRYPLFFFSRHRRILGVAAATIIIVIAIIIIKFTFFLKRAPIILLVRSLWLLRGFFTSRRSIWRGRADLALVCHRHKKGTQSRWRMVQEKKQDTNCPFSHFFFLVVFVALPLRLPQKKRQKCQTETTKMQATKEEHRPTDKLTSGSIIAGAARYSDLP